MDMDNIDWTSWLTTISIATIMQNHSEINSIVIQITMETRRKRDEKNNAIKGR